MSKKPKGHIVAPATGLVPRKAAVDMLRALADKYAQQEAALRELAEQSEAAGDNASFAYLRGGADQLKAVAKTLRTIADNIAVDGTIDFTDLLGKDGPKQ